MAAGPQDLARVVRSVGVRDVRVLEAAAHVPRAAFVLTAARTRIPTS